MSSTVKKVSSFFALARAVDRDDEDSKVSSVVGKRPVWLSFNLDRSGSMSEKIHGSDHTRWHFVARCVQTLVEFRKNSGHADDLVSVVVYNKNAMVLVPPQRIATSNMEILEHVNLEGSTSIYAGYMATHDLHQHVMNDEDSSSNLLTPKPDLIMNIDLSDGYANHDCTDADALASVKRRNFKRTDEFTNIVLATYAVSSDSDGMVPRLACNRVGPSRSIFRQLKDDEFNEFHDECALIASLCDNVITTSPSGEKVYLVLGAPTTLVQTRKFPKKDMQQMILEITVEGKEMAAPKADEEEEPTFIDKLLQELIADCFASQEFLKFFDYLKSDSDSLKVPKPATISSKIPAPITLPEEFASSSELPPLSMMQLLPRLPGRVHRQSSPLPDDYKQEIDSFKKRLLTDEIFNEFVSVVTVLVDTCEMPEQLTLMRGMSTQSERCQTIYNSYRQCTDLP
jgi:hypothetical protein